MNLDWSVHEIAVFWGEISNYWFEFIMLEKDCEWTLGVDLALPSLEMRCPPYATQDWTVDLWGDMCRVS